MNSRKLIFVLSLAALASISGCKSTSNRTSYCTQPTCTQPAVVTAVPAPPCATPVAPSCPTAGAVPPPPPGFVR